MVMRFRDWMSGKQAVQMGLWIGQRMPRWAGYGLARLAAGWIALCQPRIYRTVCANLQQVLGPQATRSEIAAMTRHVFDHAGQTYYDFFRAIGQPVDVLARAVHIPPSLIDLIHAQMAAGQGVLMLGIHTSNFDLGLLALGAHGLPAQLLSLRGPHEGFQALNDLREMLGFEVTPIAPQSLRMAIHRLRHGGLVMTGADRPVPEDRELVEFFGRPAYLPVGPARLALMTGATVLLGACYHDADAGYVLDVTGPIEMVRTRDRKADMLSNTRRLAVIMEERIRAHPCQWMMFHPVWPESSVDCPNGADRDA